MAPSFVFVLSVCVCAFLRVASAQQLGSAFAPVGSGDNLIELRKRVSALKEYYKDARTYLGKDDAVRIGGYISKLEKLQIDFLDAYPIGEVAYFTAQIGLADGTLNLVYQILRSVGSYIKFAGSILSLRIAIERARREALGTRSSATGGSLGGETRDSLGGIDAGVLASGAGMDTLDGSLLAGTGLEGLDAALLQLAGQDDLIATMLHEAQDVNEIILPWALNGGPLAPMRLATNMMALTADSLKAINEFVPPAGLLAAAI